MRNTLHVSSNKTEHPGGERIGNSILRFSLGFLWFYTLGFLFDRTIGSMEPL